jgi:uncharacterized Zn finger protein
MDGDLKEKSRCGQCGFEGEFEHRWIEGDFLVVCPSCEAINHRVKKEKIDELVAQVMSDSLGKIRDAVEDIKDRD